MPNNLTESEKTNASDPLEKQQRSQKFDRFTSLKLQEVLQKYG